VSWQHDQQLDTRPHRNYANFVLSKRQRANTSKIIGRDAPVSPNVADGGKRAAEATRIYP
jgi:hypothetical protein